MKNAWNRYGVDYIVWSPKDGLVQRKAPGLLYEKSLWLLLIGLDKNHPNRFVQLFVVFWGDKTVWKQLPQVLQNEDQERVATVFLSFHHALRSPSAPKRELWDCLS